MRMPHGSCWGVTTHTPTALATTPTRMHTHTWLAQVFLATAASHVYPGVEALVLLCLLTAYGDFGGSASAYAFATTTLWLYATSVTLGQSWFNPGALRPRFVARDAGAWVRWLLAPAEPDGAASGRCSVAHSSGGAREPSSSWSVWYARARVARHVGVSVVTRATRVLRDSRLLFVGAGIDALAFAATTAAVHVALAAAAVAVLQVAYLLVDGVPSTTASDLWCSGEGCCGVRPPCHSSRPRCGCIKYPTQRTAVTELQVSEGRTSSARQPTTRGGSSMPAATHGPPATTSVSPTSRPHESALGAIAAQLCSGRGAALLAAHVFALGGAAVTAVLLPAASERYGGVSARADRVIALALALWWLLRVLPAIGGGSACGLARGVRAGLLVVDAIIGLGVLATQLVVAVVAWPWGDTVRRRGVRSTESAVVEGMV